MFRFALWSTRSIAGRANNRTRIRSLRPLALLAITALFGIFNLTPASIVASEDPAINSMTIEIDARDLPRRLLYGTVRIPVEAVVIGDNDGTVALWYPKWMPGTHGPGGPIQNVGGLYIEDENGNLLTWEREPGEVYQINVQVPTGIKEMAVTIRYITNQSSANSTGVDTFGSELIGFISGNTVLMYPLGWRDNTTMITPTITLPENWQAASAMHVASTTTNEANEATIAYEPLTMEEFVDSPIMAARYYKEYDLIEKDMKDISPPQRLQIFSEAESVIDIPTDVHEAYQRMVTQTVRLFGGTPFKEFDMLVGTSNELGRNGLEHLSSSFNLVSQRFLQSLKGIRGWEQMLLPHEYIHSWCGKYRRPAGMVTHDFSTPNDTELLWVYEGLTQYLGKVVEVRAGLMTEEEYEWELFGNIRSARSRQGRNWRTLADTGAASHILRSGSRNWSHLRRSQDYYNEGALLWMEADAIIRNQTDGKKSLDDFCQTFFSYEEGDANPKGYDRAEIITTLNDVLEYDWAAFIHDRIEVPQEQFGLGLLKELGYQLQYSNEPAQGPNNAKGDLLDARASLGATFSSDGRVRTVNLESLADQAGLGPGMKIVGIGDYVWSKDRFVDALAETVRTGKIKLMLVSGDKYITKTIHYDGGPRFMRMVKSDDKNTRLHEILTPRKN